MGSKSQKCITPDFVDPSLGNRRGRELSRRDPILPLSCLKRRICYASQRREEEKHPQAVKYLANPNANPNDKGVASRQKKKEKKTKSKAVNGDKDDGTDAARTAATD